MYTLTKTSIREGKSSSVNVGTKSSGSTLSIIYPADGHLIVEASLSDIKDGCYVIIMSNPYDFIKTSAIESFSIEGNTVKLLTTTSEYELTYTEEVE
jgi:hypothetical protein